MRSVNIQDIAREAGVGKATVSRVINGKGYVSRETAAKVKAVMDRFHYQPSALARSLSKRESDAIGLIIPEANNPFFSGLLTGVSEVTDKCGYTLILRTSGNMASERQPLPQGYCTSFSGNSCDSCSQPLVEKVLSLRLYSVSFCS